MDYRNAGVDVQAGRRFINQIKEAVAATSRPEVLGSLGDFSGLFQLPTGYQQPVLVSGTDGVGTKLKLAQAINQHHTVGIDLVAMCANDVLTCGAEPLFFLDYLATSKLQPEQLQQVVVGIAEGCTMAGCALLGGETAEMPGFYQPDEYDLAGFCVGIVDKQQILSPTQVEAGDTVIGLASQGVHSNGFSLVRKIIAEGRNSHRAAPGWDWLDCPEVLGGASLGEVLLTPTQIYVKSVLSALRSGLEIHGMAHITGGGLPENGPRCIQPDQSLMLNPQQWPNQPIFQWLATVGDVSTTDMFDTFNMGIGFILIIPPELAQQTLTWFNRHHVNAYEIGTVIPGAHSVVGLPGHDA
ncbi:phosphoribosylformylglycinamidine cyclo-ligase [Acaryochloris sp. IP29b_bin.137]|uniref:phosphoribosylformylglycinamidine cyclo-ligase n=1 Tax=Acaryochloris sp. IP29b_bin.137 TaxID=2969217 RepID=UPI00262D8719|nr:phosphoribosylformylglycinamidine cyclo-ligase [Acaryochloris sp. IP29b_bin.137]